MSMSTMKRLMYDLKELAQNPLVGVFARPVDEANLLVWHANIGMPEHGNAVFHFVLTFPVNYPTSPPKVDLCTEISHPNVFRRPGNNNFYGICSDLFQDGEFEAAETAEYYGWSSSYTVSTLLVQLQSLLYDSQLLTAHNGFVQPQQHQHHPATNQAATQFKCSTCPHKPDAPWPCQEDEEKQEIHKIQHKTVVERPPISIPTFAANFSPKQRPADNAPCAPWGYCKIDEWSQDEKTETVVKPEKKLKQKIKQSLDTENNEKAEQALTVKDGEQEMLNFLRAWQSRAPISKSKIYKPAKKDVEVVEVSTVAGQWNAPARQVKSSSVPCTKQKEENSRQVKKTKEEKQGEHQHGWAPTVGGKQVQLLKKLPVRVILAHVFSFLPLKEIAQLSMVSKEMKSFAEDGYLWRNLFGQKYASSQLTTGATATAGTVGSAADWKYLYLLEVNHVMSNLRCFHTKHDYHEDVLGVPLIFTVNPKTTQVDYIYSSFDILSETAFEKQGVRSTCWNETFTHFLPLYITAEHFERALPMVKKTIVQLSPGSNHFAPEMVLDVLPKLINTMTVLLCDKGIQASHKACEGFVAIHRLLLGFVQKYPQLSQIAESRLSEFLRNPRKRHKKELPNLGNFLTLLLVSQNHNWSSLAEAYLSETFDRHVLWICKAHPKLASVNTSHNTKPSTEWDRLTQSFDGAKVSLRLLMFNVAFLKMAGQPQTAAARYDQFFGRPSTEVCDNFQQEVKDILAVTTWPQFFERVEVACPSPFRMTKVLKSSVLNSLRKRYHREDTVFSAIQQSGVSKILQKGESFTAQPNVKKVCFQDSWGWSQAGGAQFLDATVMVYDKYGEFVEFFDFSRTSSPTLRGITHSGDVMNHTTFTGKHKVDIDLSALPMRINTLVFALSSYSTTLKKILQPWVKFTDEGGTELCRYNLDTKSDLGANTAVTMCTMQRKEDSRTQWTVKAIGEVSMGRASLESYRPLWCFLEARLKLRCPPLPPPPPCEKKLNSTDAKKKKLGGIQSESKAATGTATAATSTATAAASTATAAASTVTAATSTITAATAVTAKTSIFKSHATAVTPVDYVCAVSDLIVVSKKKPKKQNKKNKSTQVVRGELPECKLKLSTVTQSLSKSETLSTSSTLPYGLQWMSSCVRSTSLLVRWMRFSK